MNKQSFFVTIEGLDGSGKSSCATGLSLRSDFNEVSKRSSSISESLSLAKKNEANEQTLHELYLLSLYEQSKQVYTTLKQGQNVVAARWLATEAAFHKLYSQINSTSPFAIQYQYLPIAQPDLAIFLTADSTIRKERMIKRGIFLGNDIVSLHPDADRFMHTALNELYKKYIPLNTNHMNEQEVQDEAQRIIQRHLGI